jgi:predicted permease
MFHALQDLKHAFRALRKNPAYSLAGILVLALGIGPNTAIFSVVNTVLLRPLPYPEPDRIMQLWHVPPQKSFPGMTMFSVSPANYLDWQAENKSFDAIAAYGFRSFAVAAKDRPEEIQAAAVAPDFFSILGIHAYMGRTFRAEECQPGNDHVVILSYNLWKDRFGSDSSIVGHEIRLDGQSYTVAGIMPHKFAFPGWAQLWVPLAWTDTQRAVRGNHNYLVIGKLKSGANLQTAQAELDAISLRLAQQYPEDDTGWGAVVVPLHKQMVGDLQPALLVLLGAVAFVLLIACANVANLVLAKTLSRRKELAIRTALGASGSRIILHVLSETVLLSLAGGLLGYLLAQSGIGLIVQLLGDQIPKGMEITIDGWVLGFTLLVSILTGLLAGLAPALHSMKTSPNESLKQGASRGGSDFSGNRTRRLLVVSEVALSIILLVGAGLMIRSLWQLRAVNPGFNPTSVLTAEIATPRSKYSTPEQHLAFFNRVLEQTRALPGVKSAGLIDDLPLNGGGSNQPFSIEGHPVLPMSEQPEVAVRVISPGYLNVMDIPLVKGRDFTDADIAGRNSVVVISQSMANEFWPGQDPIGQHLTLTFAPEHAREIVGIIGDVKQDELSSNGHAATIYEPFMQNTESGNFELVLRTTGDPMNQASALTSAVESVDPEQPVADLMSMGHIVDQSLSSQRFSMILLGSFAALALVLAAVGIYSVLSYTVERRFREIGIRMALGAVGKDVLRMVVLDGLRPTLLGVAIGLAGALALGRVVSSLIYGVQATDVLTFSAVSAILLLVGLVASLLPAWRATRIEPIRTLRDE